jgi:hypothetical protein
MRHWKTAVATVCSLTALATSADAQSPARHLNVELQVTELYDSNVARSNAAVAAARNVERSDYVFSPSLVADIYLPVSRQAVFLRGSTGYDKYSKNDQLDAGRTHLDAGMDFRANVCTGQLAANYSHAQTDLRDLTALTIKNIEETKGGSFTATCGRSVGLAPTVTLSNTQSDNSSPLLQLSDNKSHSVSLGLSYRRPSLGVVTLFGRRDVSKYDNRLILTPTGLVTDGFHTDSGGVRYDRHLGARIGGDVEFGYSRVKSDIPNSASFQGLTYKAGIDYRASSLLQLRLNLARSVDPTIRQSAAFAVNQTLAGEATYQMSSRLHLNAGLSSGSSRYKGAALLPTDLTKEDFKAAYGGVRWDAGRRVSLASTFRHEDRNSNIAGLDYSDSQVTVSVIGRY